MKFHKSISLLLLPLLLWVVVSACQPTAAVADAPISATGLREDFRILRKTLEEAHPGLYWYTAKGRMDAYFDSTYAQLNQDMSEVEFLTRLLPVIAHVRCLHTSVSFSDKPGHQPTRISRVLPLALYPDKGKVYIEKNYSNALHEGSQLLTINNQPINKLTNQLLRAIPADGYNQTFKEHLLTHGVFREGFALLVGQPREFALTVREPTGRTVQCTVPALSPTAINQLAATHRSEAMDLAFPKASVALLTLPTFERNNSAFRDSIRAIFRTINQRNIRTLIIDVRDNGGGNNQNVTELFSYVAARPFRHLKKTERLAKPITYGPHIKNQAAFAQLKGTRTAAGTYAMDYLYAGTSTRKPVNEYGFRGTLLVLANGGTASAASEFVALAHGYKRALVVGEETGGCYYGASGGRYLTLVLPNSQLQVRIPVIRIFTDVPEDYKRQPQGRGVLPDYAVRPTIIDRLAHEDPQFETALRLTNSTLLRPH